MEPTAGFVLCGGASRRMGTDKALLPFRGRTLVEHVAARVAEATGRPATLIGPPERYAALGLEVINEPEPGFGPLGGIVAALELGRAERNFITACDLPALDPELITQLLAAAAGPEVDAVVAAVDGENSPLCAVWKPTALNAARQALAERRLRVRDVLKSLKTVHFEVNPEILTNANTPGDWHRWSV